ncbi:uncharacterized [Tachysurus ichikawai]
MLMYVCSFPLDFETRSMCSPGKVNEEKEKDGLFGFPHEQTHLQDTGMPQARSVTLHPNFVHAQELLAVLKAFITIAMGVFNLRLWKMKQQPSYANRF